MQENWRDNCSCCPFFDQCQSSKTAEECKLFLDIEMTKKFIEAANKRYSGGRV